MAPTGAARSDGGRADRFGVYLHVPFCPGGFATWDDRGRLVAAYVDGLRREIEAAVAAGLPTATTVFLGGGTPSLLTPGQVAALLADLPLATGVEVTLECNPDTVAVATLAGYRAAGVTRVSLGAQSLVGHVLGALGPSHDPDSVQRAVAAVTAVGFGSFNLDLVYGAVGESVGDWRATLDATVALQPPHVSAYALTVEPGTPLAARPDRHPDPDDQADKYLLAEAVLGEAGLANYEISSWARPGHECRHNLGYWSQGDYRGFGCAAHSHHGGRRWWNVRTPERYLARLAGGRSVAAGGEVLGPVERRLEALQLALGTRAGVPAHALAAADLAELDGLVEVEGGRATLTVAGRLLANEVAHRLRA
ncbi:MAG: coproporphyrinogen-III oxidase family protein [Acidimicrobiales bacterium]